MAKTNENKNTELAVQTQSGYLALANPEALNFADEMNGLDISPEKIKIPSGGGLTFEVPGEDGEPEPVKEINGVIIYHHPVYMRYETKYTGGSNPPDCGSFDGKTGSDAKGSHDCKTCPYNQFGTDENGAKACKNRRRIYILREGECFPLMLSLPPASLKSFTKYLKFLLTKNRPSNSVVTRFSLKSATSGNMTYSQAVFSVDRALTAEEYAAIQPYSEQIKAYAAQVGFDTDSTVMDEDMLIDPETGEVIEPLGGRASDV
jgi:hypothetical protein